MRKFLCAAFVLAIVVAVAACAPAVSNEICEFRARVEYLEFVFAENERDIPPDLQPGDVVIVNYQHLSNIADGARGLVDSGVLLYINAPETCRLELSAILDIPLSGIPRYNRQILAGVHISKIQGLYVWGHQYIFISGADLGDGGAGLQDDTYPPEPLTFETDPMRCFSNVILLSEAISQGLWSDDYCILDIVRGVAESNLRTIDFVGRTSN